MRNRFTNITLWVVIVLIFIAFAPAVHWGDRQSMFEIVDALAVGGAVGALIRWAPSAWEALKPPIHYLRSADFLVVGLGLVCGGGALRLAGQWYWRANDKPNLWIDSAPLLYCTIAIALGFFLLLIPTFSNEKGSLARGAYIKTWVLAALSFTVGLVLIFAGWG